MHFPADKQSASTHAAVFFPSMSARTTDAQYNGVLKHKLRDEKKGPCLFEENSGESVYGTVNHSVVVPQTEDKVT